MDTLKTSTNKPNEFLTIPAKDINYLMSLFNISDRDNTEFIKIEFTGYFDLMQSLKTFLFSINAIALEALNTKETTAHLCHIIELCNLSSQIIPFGEMELLDKIKEKAYKSDM